MGGCGEEGSAGRRVAGCVRAWGSGSGASACGYIHFLSALISEDAF